MSAIVPVAIIFFVLVVRFPRIPHWTPKPIRSILRWFITPFEGFLDLAEAEAYLDDGSSKIPIAPGPGDSEPERDAGKESKSLAPFWVVVSLSSIAMSEVTAWLAIGVYRLAILGIDPDGDASLGAWGAFVLALTWLYAAVVPFARLSSTPTAPMDLFSLYIAHFLGAVLVLGGVLFDVSVGRFDRVSYGNLTLAAYVLNFGAVVSLMVVTLSRPVGIPSARIDRSEIVSGWVFLFWNVR